MKLRIRGNSIRFRLTKEEVAKFGESGIVQDCIEFGVGEDKKLFYRLENSENSAQINAVFENGRITLRIPKSAAEQWTRTEQVGFETKQLLDNENELRILVEKDFACLKPRSGEDNADTFPHPQENAQC